MRRLKLSVFLLAALTGPALAAPYEAFIDVETVEDLDDLLVTGQIDTETHDSLYELLSRGVDLDRATRAELYSLPNLTYDEVDAILRYRDTQGFIAKPSDLVAAGAITEQKLLAISAFLISVDRTRRQYQPRGNVAIRTRAAQGDHELPPIMLRGRASFGKDLSAGFAATLTRYRIKNVAWDPNHDALVADEGGLQPHLPKAYVRYHTDKIDVIVGSYRAGFDQRLTFDNSADYTPNGLYADNQLNSSVDDLTKECKQSTGELIGSPCSSNNDYVTPDFTWSDGLLGLGVGSDHLSIGDGSAYLQAFAWASYQLRSIYQYEVANRNAECTDPRNNLDPDCDAVRLLLRNDDDPLAPLPALSYRSLPNAYGEAVFGAHVAMHTARRDYVGITAYTGDTNWLIDTPETVNLDAQEWSRLPMGGRYGAVGASAGIGRGIYDGFAEITRSFDNLPPTSEAAQTMVSVEDSQIHGGGGFAAILRGTRSLRKREIEVSLRYYDPDFVNPFAGPIAQSDEVEGQRARGEQGARVKYTGQHGNLTLRMLADFWRGYVVATAKWAPRLQTYVHGDLKASDQIGYGLWVDFKDKDLRETAYGSCYDIDPGEGPTQEPVSCTGMQLKTRARLRYTVDRKLSFAGELQHSWVDDQRYKTKRRSDLTANVNATWRPQPGLRVRGRVKYLFEDISDAGRLEEYVWGYAELVKRMRLKDSLTVRADLFYWLDSRASTGLRSPQPELRVLGAYETRF